MDNSTHDTATALEPGSGSREIDWGKLGWGLAILIVGLLFTLDRFALINTDELWRWTPLVLITIGLVGLLRGKTPKARDGGWWLLIIGLYLLVNFLELWDFYWDTSWPLFLIMIGLAHLIDPGEPGERAGSVWWLGLGGFFLIVQRGVFGLDFDDLWPVLLVFAGLAVIWRALTRGRKEEVCDEC